MSELLRLLTAYDAERAAGKTCALATVVEVLGSAYRRPGARMLVTAEGQLTGTISGGCLEGDARRRAQQVMMRGRPEVIVYDSTDIDDDLENGAQLGCQGQIHILLEPVDVNDVHNPLELLRGTYLQDQPSVLATVLKSTNPQSLQIGERFLLDESGHIKGDFGHSGLLNLHLLPGMQAVLHSSQSLNNDYEIDGLTARVFLELIAPAPYLSIYGAGNDAQPLVRMAAALGWRVAVMDGRPMLPTKIRFPEAETVQVVKLNELAQQARPRGFAVLMSHNYYYDLEVLMQLSREEALNYIGVLGPKKKLDLMLSAMSDAGLDTTQLNGKLHGPVGLDIGAETAEEIAIAVMAELMAVRKGLAGGFLRDVDSPIHRPLKTDPKPLITHE